MQIPPGQNDQNGQAGIDDHHGAKHVMMTMVMIRIGRSHLKVRVDDDHMVNMVKLTLTPQVMIKKVMIRIG